MGVSDLSRAKIETAQEPSHRGLLPAALLLGIGFGGFVDGIVFHQLLQFHNMLSAKYPVRGVDSETLAVNLEINMFWDGVFHLFCWVVAIAGLLLLWKALRRAGGVPSSRVLLGGMLAGWGLFNLVEGVINHHVLHLHHVVERPGHLVFDLAFLGTGVVLMVTGWLLARPQLVSSH